MPWNWTYTTLQYRSSSVKSSSSVILPSENIPVQALQEKNNTYITVHVFIHISEYFHYSTIHHSSSCNTLASETSPSRRCIQYLPRAGNPTCTRCLARAQTPTCIQCLARAQNPTCLQCLPRAGNPTCVQCLPRAGNPTCIQCLPRIHPSADARLPRCHD
jgi:hypothetical protein